MVDVTKIFSASATGVLPDFGYLIKFSASIESDANSYFVKRFGSIQSSNVFKRPTLHIKYNDFIIDDRMFATYNVDGNIYLKNSYNNAKKNLLSGSTELSGDNCVLVKLDYTTNNITYLTASQIIQNGYRSTGVYSASFNIDGLNTYVSSSYTSGSNITIHEKWTSLDEKIMFYTGSFSLKKSSANFTSTRQNKQVVIYNLKNTYKSNEKPRINLFIKQFLKDEPAVRTPVVAASDFEKFVYFRIKTAKGGKIVIPFSDFTRCSVDNTAVYFELPTHSLNVGKSYNIDVKIINNGVESIHLLKNTFKVE